MSTLTSSRALPYPKEAGIYKITCKPNGKIYIGKAVNIRKRISVHKAYSKGSKVDSYFKRAVVKYGWDSFTIDIIEIIEDFDKNNDDHKLQILEREAYYINLFDSTNTKIGYNRCEYGSDRTGKPHTEETKEKIRKGNIGRIVSDETREKLRIANTGKKLSIETRAKMSQTRIGNTNHLGVPNSSETRAKISKGNRGRIFSEEHRENLRRAGLGKKHSDETKEKIRQAKFARDKAKLDKLKEEKLNGS